MYGLYYERNQQPVETITSRDYAKLKECFDKLERDNSVNYATIVHKALAKRVTMDEFER